MGGKSEVSLDKEGVNPLYKLLATTLLLYMERYSSTRFHQTINLIKRVVQRFETKLRDGLNDPRCINAETLSRHRLLKRKHYLYGSYLATLTSFPLLHRCTNEKIFDSILAKTSAITSVKVFDNINDKLHSGSQAIPSLLRLLKAFTEEDFALTEGTAFVHKAENSCYRMARWTYGALREGLSDTSEMFKEYREDFKRCIEGQIGSMDQRIDEKERGARLGLRKFLKKANEKSVGRIWIDIDFCFLESEVRSLDGNELLAVQHVKEAADYIFKGCNIYDDVADLEEDLSLGILNSVVLLAMERGNLSTTDLNMDRSKLGLKLRERGSIKEAIQLGDLIFNNGIKHLLIAQDYSDAIDLGALFFGARILRAFSMRKWFLHDKGIRSLANISKSFTFPRSLSIPDHIQAYEKYI